jgi:hypothetical protein
MEKEHKELIKTIEREKKEIEEKWKQYKELSGGSAEIMKLDIGGTHKLTVSKAVLTSVEDSFLAKLFSGR